MGGMLFSCRRPRTTSARETVVLDSPAPRPVDLDVAYASNEQDLIAALLNNCPNEDLVDRLLGCAYGQALGDAYGLSTEFENRQRVAHNYPDRTKLIPFPDYKLTAHSSRWTRGDWTDDTDQWILILETILEANGDVRVFAGKLKTWIERGFPDLGDQGGMGLGANVGQVVFHPEYLANPLEASRLVWERSNRKAAPNGAVMRCSATALVHFDNPEKLKATTISMCKTTHFDPRCLASCLSVCLLVARLLKKKMDRAELESAIDSVQRETIQILGGDFPDEQRDAFLWHIDRARTLEDLNLDEPAKIGYTYKCMASGFYGVRSEQSFEKTLNDLIRYGGDADTNGAVCGTMYGARHGYKALPAHWLQAMPYKKWLDKKLIDCLTQMKVLDSNVVITSM